MKDIKASNPVELAEYSIANNIEDEHSFKWWVNDVLFKQYRIVSKVRAKYWITTHKSGIQVPKTIDQTYKTHQQAGTTFRGESK